MKPIDYLWRARRHLSRWSDWDWLSWLIVLMVLVTVYDVLARYFFHQGSAFLQELEWHLFAVLFLCGAAHTLRHDGHVRVDFLRVRMTARWRCLIDLAGHLFFLLPFCGLLIYTSLDFVEPSFRHRESSPDAGGMPYRWLIKSAIPLGFALLLVQGLACILRCLRLLCRPLPSARRR